MAMLDVIRPCAAWIPILWGEKLLELFTKRNRAIPELPLDIIINILTRLPAKCIFRLWQIKSNQLYALSKTPSFIRTHLDRATQTIVVHSFTQSDYDVIKLFFFDEETKNVEARSLYLAERHALYRQEIIMCGSYDGFLLFKARKMTEEPFFCIWNPITKEQVTLTSTSLADLIYVCGFYFHPRKMEYEVVLVCFFDRQCHFQILNLRNRQRRNVGSSCYRPYYDRPSVFINGILYWMVDLFWYHMNHDVYPSCSHSILTFNTETEELSTMGTVNISNDIRTSIIFRENLQLFELEGDLCLFDRSSRIEVGIWVFSCVTKCWVKLHSMMVPDGHHWNFNWYFNEVAHVKTKGEFLATDQDKRLISCNPRLGTWKFVEKNGFKGDDFTVMIHTHSLVSLHAADTIIPLKRFSVGAGSHGTTVETCRGC